MEFYINALSLGIALAMDAFSVSIANSLRDQSIQKNKAFKMSAAFGFAQFLMPMIGWWLIHTLIHIFQFLIPFVPWVACIVLSFLGLKMIMEAKEQTSISVTGGTIFTQAIATSIDALSIGLVMADYNFQEAIITACIIGVVTTGICYMGVLLGKKLGEKIGDTSGIFGGILLIIIGIKILLEGIL